MGVVVLQPETHPGAAGAPLGSGLQRPQDCRVTHLPSPCSTRKVGSGEQEMFHSSSVDFSSLENTPKCSRVLQWLFKHGRGCEGGSGQIFTNGLVKSPSRKIGCLDFQVGAGSLQTSLLLQEGAVGFQLLPPSCSGSGRARTGVPAVGHLHEKGIFVLSLERRSQENPFPGKVRYSRMKFYFITIIYLITF